MFGTIRIEGTEKEPLFCASDVCKALGFSNPWKAVGDHVDDDESEEDLMARALIVAKATLKRREERIKALETENYAKDKEIVELSSTISDMKPKVNYVDMILASKETVTTTQIAQKLWYSAQGRWSVDILYAKYLPCGYVHSETVPIVHSNGTSGSVMHTKWTQKGRLFLYDELKPTIEQELVKR